jgi:phosphoglycerol transferase
MNRFRHWKLESTRIAILLLTVTSAWCVTMRKCNLADWQFIPVYLGDAWNYAAWAKSASEGQFLPFMPKFNRYLNAPFGASWNDFPSTEDFLWAATGLGTRLFGLFPALNLFYLMACLLAATSFYLTGRYLRYRWEWCVAGAVAFGLSPYALTRSIHHLALTYYWHIPLCLLVTWWVASRTGLRFWGRRYWVAIGVAAVTGWQNPYYTSWFLQLLGLGATAHAIRLKSWKSLLPPTSIAAATLLAFLSANLDTLIYQAQAGPNSGAVGRTYAHLEMFALRPVELFLPVSHRSPTLTEFTKKYKSDLAMPINEPSYLGMLGAAGFLAMCGQMIVSLMRRSGRPDGRALQALWLTGYSIVGGLNGVLGVGGLLLFRGQNRVSIFLLALALFFVIQRLSRLSIRWPRPLSAAGALLLSIVVLWDQWPYILHDYIFDATREIMESDRAFAKRMEKELPPGGMVFQLPVLPYPEAGDLDYEHFRPYLFTKSLRYTYGTIRGRGDEDWQSRVAAMSPAEQIATLEKYGFAAICTIRRAYPGNGRELEAAFTAEGRQIIVSRHRDLSCIVLRPAAQPELPERTLPTL